MDCIRQFTWHFNNYLHDTSPKKMGGSVIAAFSAGRVAWMTVDRIERFLTFSLRGCEIMLSSGPLP